MEATHYYTQDCRQYQPSYFSAVSILLFISRHYTVQKYRDGCFSHACISWNSQSPTHRASVVDGRSTNASICWVSHLENMSNTLVMLDLPPTRAEHR
jgi:hypothetical protein